MDRVWLVGLLLCLEGWTLYGVRLAPVGCRCRTLDSHIVMVHVVIVQLVLVKSRGFISDPRLTIHSPMTWQTLQDLHVTARQAPLSTSLLLW